MTATEWAHNEALRRHEAGELYALTKSRLTTFTEGALFTFDRLAEPHVVAAVTKALWLDHGTDAAGATAPDIAAACHRMALAALDAARRAITTSQPTTPPADDVPHTHPQDTGRWAGCRACSLNLPEGA